MDEALTRRNTRDRHARLLLRLFHDLSQGGELGAPVRAWLLSAVEDCLINALDGGKHGGRDIEEMLRLYGAPLTAVRLLRDRLITNLGAALGGELWAQARQLEEILRDTVEGRRVLAELPEDQRRDVESLRQDPRAPASVRQLFRILTAKPLT